MKSKFAILLATLVLFNSASFAATNDIKGGSSTGGGEVRTGGGGGIDGGGEVRAGGGGGIDGGDSARILSGSRINAFSEHTCARTGEKVKCENSAGCDSEILCAPVNSSLMNDESMT